MSARPRAKADLCAHIRLWQKTPGLWLLTVKNTGFGPGPTRLVNLMAHVDVQGHQKGGNAARRRARSLACVLIMQRMMDLHIPHTHKCSSCRNLARAKCVTEKGSVHCPRMCRPAHLGNLPPFQERTGMGMDPAPAEGREISARARTCGRLAETSCENRPSCNISAEDPALGGLWWSQRPTRAQGAVHVGWLGRGHVDERGE